ncbi:hypothetical protein PTSG_01913 [Salpingoeca rosetta]|uniref:rRNA methyltransferase 1, mitochondrial n=1 Tax=Salpingoeca rosetta (strain ATCC 50818 / BSB-021) TaxID=946362 RepID=F2TZB5_SALR5|nr:uncharacterized protein PTSG_01913 [Salpingoeca rosetta]EGD78939.1 hypothetical protein PTSG_01913 [Salpingoeca rosetta]|eukprot:XP_004997895.1 hypothetical protein PTSG_01913 [Salpingoeca rosetta]
MEVLCGRHAVAAALAAGRRRVGKLLVTQGAAHLDFLRDIKGLQVQGTKHHPQQQRQPPRKHTQPVASAVVLEPQPHHQQQQQQDRHHQQHQQHNKGQVVPVEVVSRHQLDKLTAGAVHQGVALRASQYPLDPWSLAMLERDVREATAQPNSSHLLGDPAGARTVARAAKPARTTPPSQQQASSAFPPLSLPPRLPLYVLVTGVQDPVNLGSILRSSYCLGVRRVFLSDRQTLKPTSTVSKSSAGALELLDVHTVRDEASFIAHAADHGFLSFAACMQPNANSQQPHMSTADLLLPTQASTPPSLSSSLPSADALASGATARGALLVVGNEHRGIHANVVDACTATLAVDQHRSHLVDSLNVGVAAGILIHAIALWLHRQPA